MPESALLEVHGRKVGECGWQALNLGRSVFLTDLLKLLFSQARCGQRGLISEGINSYSLLRLQN